MRQVGYLQGQYVDFLNVSPEANYSNCYVVKEDTLWRIWLRYWSRVGFPMVSLEFFIYTILRAAL